MLYRALAQLGHTVADVREMYLWQCASFLGVDGRDPVIVGSRSLVLPDDASHGSKGYTPTLSDERVAEAKRRFDERARRQHAEQQAAAAAAASERS